MRMKKIKNKKAYLIVMLIMLVIVFICGVVAIRKYMEQKRDKRLFLVEKNNDDYREWLVIGGKCSVSVDEVRYEETKQCDYGIVYRKIAVIKVFNPESTFDYDDVPELFAEYDAFCETGDESEMLNKFGSDYERASNNAWDYEHIFVADILSHIYMIKMGNLGVNNSQAVRRTAYDASPEFDEEYLQLVDSLNGNEELAASMYYEKYSDIFIAWVSEP